MVEPTGQAMWVQQEADLDAVTALSGSGPAYVFYFIEGMMQAAQDMGLSAEQGRQLALATFGAPPHWPANRAKVCRAARTGDLERWHHLCGLDQHGSLGRESRLCAGDARRKSAQANWATSSGAEPATLSDSVGQGPCQPPGPPTVSPSQWFKRKALKQAIRSRPLMSHPCHRACAPAANSDRLNHRPRPAS